MILTTEALVTEKPEKKSAPAGGHGVHSLMHTSKKI
jgi:hypothetical protein